MYFKVLFDVYFDSICAESLSPIERKKVLSLYNDFENGKWRYDQFQNFIWDQYNKSRK